MVVVTFLPQAFAQLRRTHVSVDLLSSRLSPRLSAGIQGTAAVFAVCLFGLLTYVSGYKAWHATVVGEISKGLMNYPVWPFRWFMPIGFGVLVLQFIDTAIGEFSKVVKK
jgi:TRAP-type mannitol/chloroaromatic compound transport system permease small subunit